MRGAQDQQGGGSGDFGGAEAPPFRQPLRASKRGEKSGLASFVLAPRPSRHRRAALNSRLTTLDPERDSDDFTNLNSSPLIVQFPPLSDKDLSYLLSALGGSARAEPAGDRGGTQELAVLGK